MNQNIKIKLTHCVQYLLLHLTNDTNHKCQSFGLLLFYKEDSLTYENPKTYMLQKYIHIYTMKYNEMAA